MTQSSEFLILQDSKHGSLHTGQSPLHFGSFNAFVESNLEEGSHIEYSMLRAHRLSMMGVFFSFVIMRVDRMLKPCTCHVLSGS